MTFLDILRTAVFALRGNWLRSALTCLLYTSRCV